MHNHDHHDHHHHDVNEKEGYSALAIIIGLITLISLLVAFRFDENGWFSSFMLNFMGGFFIVFAAFKFINLKEFAMTYPTYDLLAKKLPLYGYIYPFLEAGLGTLYILRLFLPQINLFTFVLMSFSGVGVLLTIRQKKNSQCACLGTVIKLPLSTITLIEDFGMAAMALLMLIV